MHPIFAALQLYFLLYLFININQLDALNFLISLFEASTCFEHHVLIVRRAKLHYTVSGIITPIGGRPVYGTATSWASQPRKSTTLSPQPGGKPRKFIRTCDGIGERKRKEKKKIMKFTCRYTFHHHPSVLNGGNLQDKQDTQNRSTFVDGSIRKTCKKFKQ